MALLLLVRCSVEGDFVPPLVIDAPPLGADCGGPDPTFALEGFQFARDVLVNDYVHLPHGKGYRVTFVCCYDDGTVLIEGVPPNRVSRRDRVSGIHPGGVELSVTRLVNEDLEPS